MSETNIPFLAPGCFGSALHFQGEGMVCAACPFKGECEPVHNMALQAMRERLGIKMPPVRRAAPLPTNEEATEDGTRLTLPKKVRELLGKLDRENLDITGKMKQGVNPFAGLGRYGYMMITCHLIMHLRVPVTQKIISAGLATKLGWANGTADAHARMAVQALEHVGAIDNNDGIFSVRKSK
ncbi:hypothetical protein PXK56_17850 [Phaeobacter gallaeciensis]|uniref:hypothetical protein n=1 Tax=Phaeobacter gallaeciensis TaxID=60890 RepID=UPI002380921F|nr:hypothetical protein [Phaeobacter gallaeciensis]MDE4297053.1 hypothetical protein [Phaeobacter gallaeciensis]